jgi:hypothetical protein
MNNTWSNRYTKEQKSYRRQEEMLFINAHNAHKVVHYG